MIRDPDCCPHAERKQRGGKPGVLCRFVWQLVKHHEPLDGRVCDECCKYPLPQAESLNPVLASVAYRLAKDQLCRLAGDDPNRDSLARLAARSESQLATAVDSESSSVRLADLMDRTVTAARLHQLIEQRQPFAFVRYGDGEWLSMLAEAGSNSDGHDLMPETLGVELRNSLRYFATRCSPHAVYVGMISRWREVDLIQFLSEEGYLRHLHWVSALLFVEGLANLQTKALFESLRKYSGRKLMVANDSLRPVADALGFTHVSVSTVNCYQQIDALEMRCRFEGAGLVVCCAGMASECLIMRLHRRNPAATYLDMGHIFDMIVGRMTRQYLQRDVHRLLPIIRTSYQSMLTTPTTGPPHAST